MILEEYGFRVETAVSLEEGAGLCFSDKHDVIITEFFPPPEKTLAFIKRMIELDHKPYLILSTSFIIDDQTHQRLFQAGLDDLLIKPYGRKTLWAHVQKGLERREQRLSTSLPSPSLAAPESFGVLTRENFSRFVRREIKKAKRHQEPFSLILLKLPSQERLGSTFPIFYQELTALLRKSVREEDLIGRENGNLGIILEKTDERGSKVLGERLIAMMTNHPAFQTDPSFQSILKELVLEYYTFPHTHDVPSFIKALITEIQGEEKSR